MKTLSIISTASALLALTACGSLGTQYGYVDDVYYNPATHANNVATDQFSKSPSLNKEQQQAYNDDFNRLRSQYENSQQTQNPNANLDEIQQQYAQILGNDSIEETDTLLYYNDETGYWVNDFQGSDMDRDYAERLAKFHGPFNGIPYWSPLYNDLVYGYNPYWNVYVDGNYAYVSPTWSNPYYFNYYTSPGWSFGFGWNYGWGYNYWGYGYYDPWYNPWYGWYSPYYSWGYPWHHHGGGWAGGSSDRVYAPRYGHATGRSQGSGGSVSSRATSQYNTTSRSAYRNGGTNVSSYSSRTQQPGSGDMKNTTTGTDQRTTRQSYTPTYSQTESTSRPTYNRSATPRQSGNVSTGTTRSSSQATTPSSTQSATPQRSSSYNGSTYRPSGNSNYKSTTTPSSSSGSSTRQSSSSPSSTYSAPRSSSSSNTPSSSGSYSNGSSRSYSGGSAATSGGSSSGGSSSGGGGSSRSSRR
ncbi:MAG: hypothetical protein QM786_05555 [Breznakibacter sp.]